MDWTLKDYERDSAFENDACLPYLQEQPEPDPGVANDVKLISFGSKTTTAKDAGVESVGLDQRMVLAQDRAEYTDI